MENRFSQPKRFLRFFQIGPCRFDTRFFFFPILFLRFVSVTLSFSLSMFVYVCEVYCVKHVFFIINSYQKLRIRIFFVRELKRFALSLQIRFFCLNSFALCIGFGKNMRIELRKYLNSIYIFFNL